jgi:hypothetical protein
MIIPHFYTLHWFRWRPKIRLYKERYYTTLPAVYKGKEIYFSWGWFNLSVFKGGEEG